MIALVAVFIGDHRDREVGLSITALRETPPEALDHATQLGIKALEAKYPGVQNARQEGDWQEIELPEEEL